MVRLSATADRVMGMAAESFIFWFKIFSILFRTAIKAFLIYTPMVLFWIMFASVDFNGALFVAILKELNRENITPVFSIIGTTIFLGSFMASVLREGRFYDGSFCRIVKDERKCG